MRLKEPFIGFRLISGHTPAHIIFLMGSYLIEDPHLQHSAATYDKIGIIKVSGVSTNFIMSLARSAHMAAVIIKFI